MDILKVIFALIISIIILLAGWYPLALKKAATRNQDEHKEHIDFGIGETLATGIFLGAAFMHMLPEANALFHNLGFNYPFAFIITGLVFLLFLWCEHLGQELYHQPLSKLAVDECRLEVAQHGTGVYTMVHEDSSIATTTPASSTVEFGSNAAFAILAWAMLSLHSIMLGAALGVNNNNTMIIMLFIAIITHKWAESFAIAVQLAKSSLSFRQSVGFFLSFCLMTPLGIFMGWYFGHVVNSNSVFEPILIAASAGTFLYLGTLHGLERCVMVERCCNLRDFSFVIIGFLLMAAVAAYV